MSLLFKQFGGLLAVRPPLQLASRAFLSTSIPQLAPGADDASGPSNTGRPHVSYPSMPFGASSSSSSSSATPPRRASAFTMPQYNFGSGSPLPHSNIAVREREVDPEAWWHQISAERVDGRPGNRFTGRSLPTSTLESGLEGTMDALARRMKRSRLTRTKMLSLTWEQPSNRRFRKRSERHRKRFRAMVWQKVRELTMVMRRR